MTEKIVLYYDGGSEPCRAVYWFCLLNDIPVELKLISLAKRDNMKEEFASVSPNKKIPLIQHNGRYIFESHTILRYLAEVYSTADNWFPHHDIIQRSNVNMYLDWHHLTLRFGCSTVCVGRKIGKIIGKHVNEIIIEQGEIALVNALRLIDGHFLKLTPYILGQQPSIADLSCFSEIMQLDVLPYDLLPFPNIILWKERMKTLPFYDKVFRILFLMETKLSKL